GRLQAPKSSAVFTRCRPGQLHPVDTCHGLRGTGGSLSQVCEIKVLPLSQSGLFRKDVPSNHHAGSGPHPDLGSTPCASMISNTDSTAASICTPEPCTCASSIKPARSSSSATCTPTPTPSCRPSPPSATTSSSPSSASSAGTGWPTSAPKSTSP